MKKEVCYLKELRRLLLLVDRFLDKKGEGVLNQLIILIFVIVAIILAFFVFYKITTIKDIILNLFG